MGSMRLLCIAIGAIFSFSAMAHQQLSEESLPVISSLDALKQAGAKVIEKDEELGVGYSIVSSAQQKSISEYMHRAGKCGGFEVLPERILTSASQKSLLNDLKKIVEKDKSWQRPNSFGLQKRPEIVAALSELKGENIKATVEWLSSYPSRSNRLPNPNLHVDELESRVKVILEQYPGMFSVQKISHSRTKQKTLRVHLQGKSRPSEIVVLGGHLDSINQGWGGSDLAPGADDNASGSANLLEALRVLVSKGRPERSVEFFWYAGEESGLLGSAEIAQNYKAEGKDVVAVLQLDMTLFPGSGELVIGNVEDFTSAWLRGYLEAVNELYLGVKLIADKCGYACSDHASWYRQGYPTLMPFESDTANMNRNIHTDRDKINESTSFRHSLVFAKIALILAMDLGNSIQRQPY